MCDFKPGDEVVCVDDSPGRTSGLAFPCARGAVYIVRKVWFPGDVLPTGPRTTTTAVALVGMPDWNPNPHVFGIAPSRFRKVQKRKDTRNLTEWLSQPSFHDEEQQSPAPRSPAKKRERA